VSSLVAASDSTAKARVLAALRRTIGGINTPQP